MIREAFHEIKKGKTESMKSSYRKAATPLSSLSLSLNFSVKPYIQTKQNINKTTDMWLKIAELRNWEKEKDMPNKQLKHCSNF